jgi:hypothetical protein
MVKVYYFTFKIILDGKKNITTEYAISRRNMLT